MFANKKDWHDDNESALGSMKIDKNLHGFEALLVTKL